MINREKLEVGDIIKAEDGALIHIYEDLGDNLYNIAVYQENEGYWTAEEFHYDPEYYTYIGKAEAKMENLFKLMLS